MEVFAILIPFLILGYGLYKAAKGLEEFSSEEKPRKPNFAVYKQMHGEGITPHYTNTHNLVNANIYKYPNNDFPDHNPGM